MGLVRLPQTLRILLQEVQDRAFEAYRNLLRPRLTRNEFGEAISRHFTALEKIGAKTFLVRRLGSVGELLTDLLEVSLALNLSQALFNGFLHDTISFPPGLLSELR